MQEDGDCLYISKVFPSTAESDLNQRQKGGKKSKNKVNNLLILNTIFYLFCLFLGAKDGAAE